MPQRGPSPQTERGATLVEMAIVLPLLLRLAIGLMEMGIATKEYLTVSTAVRDGVRVAALAGNDPDADCAVLREVGSILGVLHVHGGLLVVRPLRPVGARGGFPAHRPLHLDRPRARQSRDARPLCSLTSHCRVRRNRPLRRPRPALTCYEDGVGL